MIKLQDFAKECGVTDRAIQKHLVTYADELEGLYQRRGPNGTWLSDEACEILRSKMRQNPVVLGDKKATQDMAAMQQQILELQSKLIAAHEVIAAQRAQLDAGNEAVLRLQAAEQQSRNAQEALGAAQREVGSLRERLERQAQEAAEAAQVAQEQIAANQQAVNNAWAAAQQSAQQTAAAQAEVALLRQELESLRNASFWQRLRGWHK